MSRCTSVSLNLALCEQIFSTAFAVVPFSCKTILRVAILLPCFSLWAAQSLPTEIIGHNYSRARRTWTHTASCRS